MKAHFIPRKKSGTGTIHDISSDLYDREIKFRAGTKYAVVLASYYGGKGYTTHKTADAAIQKARSLGDAIYHIIDTDGCEYWYNVAGELYSC